MPRARSSQNVNGGPSAADIAELRAAVAQTLSKVRVEVWPGDDWQRLVFAAIRKGYSVSISPQMGGRGVKISILVDRGRIPMEAMTNTELEEGVRALILAVDKLPVKD